MGKKYWFINGNIVLEDRILRNGSIEVTNGVISKIMSGQPKEIHSSEIQVTDIKGNWIVPGFIDVHVHGAAGYSFMSHKASEIEEITRFFAKHGTTSLLATTTTTDEDSITNSIVTLSNYIHSNRREGSRIIGIHLEGPFLTLRRKGAQDPKYILKPDLSLVKKWVTQAQNTIRLMTLAPEVEGNDEIIRFLVSSGVKVSAGHTDATYHEAVMGIRNGVSQATHTFNGMRPLHHREPGVLGAVLEDDSVYCQMISDGHHIHKNVMRLLYRIKGPDKVVLITDAIEATGKPDGEYALGKQPVRLQNGKVELLDGSSLAGSVLTMDQAYRNILSVLPVSMVEASKMASTNPAMSIGLGQRKGKIEEGFDADLVVLDEQFNVTKTIIEGEAVFSKD